MHEDHLLEAVYNGSGKAYLKPADMKPLQGQFGSQFTLLYDKLKRGGYLHPQINPVGQIVLSLEGFERAKDLFD